MVLPLTVGKVAQVHVDLHRLTARRQSAWGWVFMPCGLWMCMHASYYQSSLVGSGTTYNMSRQPVFIAYTIMDKFVKIIWGQLKNTITADIRVSRQQISDRVLQLIQNLDHNQELEATLDCQTPVAGEIQSTRIWPRLPAPLLDNTHHYKPSPRNECSLTDRGTS